MSFQSYLKNIELKTGKTPEDFIILAKEKHFLKNDQLKPTVRAGEIIQWLKEDHQLGHGHAMAIYAFIKGKRE